MSKSNQGVIDAPKTEKRVAASINERRLFTSLKHLFASSFSVLGELMQNARRAGATGIDFLFDAEKRLLEIIDDGCGIDDFGVLLALCDSGWDEQTMLSDRPFGMGFFSVFFACEKVTITSNGHFIEAVLDDIASRRAIPVQKAKSRARGTRIMLQGVSEALMKKGYSQQLLLPDELRRYARGFPIPVRLNGEELPRPHALADLRVIRTELGHIHDRFLCAGQQDTSEIFSHSRNTALYLQGLPIEYANEQSAAIVVHLDTQKFVPQMPDRHSLFDAGDQLRALADLHRQLVRQKLCVLKETVGAERFVRGYWDMCKKFNALDLMNDIPFIPANFLHPVRNVAWDSSDTFGYRHNDQPGALVARSDFANGTTKAWRNVTAGYDEGGETHNGVILKIMQREGIFAFRGGDLPNGHWIYEVCPNAAEFEVEVIHPEPVATRDVYTDGPDVEIRLVDSAKVTITSCVDPQFRIEREIDDDWLPFTEVEADDDPGEPVCLVMRKDASPDHPADFFANFQDENDRYDESYRDQTAEEWDSAISAMKGAGLCEQLRARLRDAERSLVLAEHNDGQMVLMYAQHVNKHYRALRAEDLENADTWQILADSIRNCATLDGAALKAAFAEAFGVQAKSPEPSQN